MKWVKLIPAIACALLLSSGVAMAITEDSALISNKKKVFKHRAYKEVTWFSTYDVGGDAGTTYKYNEEEGTTDADGLVGCRRYDLRKTVMIDLITLGSTSVDVRVEGRPFGSGEWGEIVTINFTGATGANNAHIVNVVEFVEAIRVGVKANTAGTDSITITGILMGDS